MLRPQYRQIAKSDEEGEERVPLPSSSSSSNSNNTTGSDTARIGYHTDTIAFVGPRWYLRYPLALLGLFVSVLTFGTVYSDWTARDPCEVLSLSLQQTRSMNKMMMPKLFHYQSKTNAMTKETTTWHAMLGMTAASQVYPNIITNLTTWTSVYWSDDACAKLVRDHFASFLHVYETFPHNIQRVDSCRYLILYMYGGIYADTDISLHSNLLEKLVPDGVGLVESPYRYNEKWQNSLMTAAAPEHPFWNTTIQIMEERKGSKAVLSTTGPKMIGDAVERYREGSSAHNIHTLPCELFQRLPSGQWADTTFLNILGRDVLARAIPMRGCGRYGDGRCEVTRHSGKATWTVESGKLT